MKTSRALLTRALKRGCVALCSVLSMCLILGNDKTPADWDGQYEGAGEDSGGGRPFHYSLFICTTGQATRIILNGGELSNVVMTATGFSGRANGRAGSASFRTVNGASAVVFNREGIAPFGLDDPFLTCVRVKGPADAQAAFDKAERALRQFDQFLKEFKSALAAPTPEAQRRLKPLFQFPLIDERPDTGDGRKKQGSIPRLTTDFVTTLKAADYSQAARGPNNGPFDYLLLPRNITDPKGGPNLKAEFKEGKFLITRIVYLP